MKTDGSRTKVLAGSVSSGTASPPLGGGRVASEAIAAGRSEAEPHTRFRDWINIPARELHALAGAILFLLLGFAALYIVTKLAGVRNGTVLAALLIIPPLLYLLLSGRVSDFKGPGGWS